MKSRDSAAVARGARLLYSEGVRRTGLAYVLVSALLACATDRAAVAPVSRVGPAETLERFTGALLAQRWPEAYAMLSSQWRARYTPARLAADYVVAGSVAREAADRAHALLAAGQRPVQNGNTATLAVGKGRTSVLVEEDGAWRVDALE